jgi:heat shock protein HtpX
MWEQIQSNKRRSVVLVVLIALLLVILGFVIGEAMQPGAGPIGLAVAALLWVVMSLIAYFQGDDILLAVSGAKEIEKKDHPQLFNVVEEMSIAGGMGKVPRVFIMDDMALNAFATGRDPNHAAVAVTAGLLGKLKRDELQGVVAHEMSHVVNRDVLLMTMVGVMLGSIVMISEIFLRGLRFGAGGGRRYRSGRGGGQAQAIMMLVAIAFAILAPIIAQLIYFAISRRREYLADANAAVLTRYPEGLASALEQIGLDENVLERANKATAPMFIVNPFAKAGRFAAGLASTHPPIDERIRVLRSIAGTVSFQQYDAAWRTVRGSRRGVMPASALSGGEAQSIRTPLPDDEKSDERKRMREAGDVLRKVNQFLFLPCVCGLKLKLPPDFKQDKVSCPRCHRELEVPVAQVAAAAQVGALMAEQAQAPLRTATPKVEQASPGAALQIARQGSGWASFKCTCGQPLHIAPGEGPQDIECPKCGQHVSVNQENNRNLEGGRT